MALCKCNSCKRPAREDGYCLTHSPTRQREARRKNPERFKKYSLKRDYGISLQLYQEILVAQGGRCAGCGALSGSERSNNNGYKSLSVDHDHKTGAVRGLLCSRCNKGIGDLLDSPALLRRLADYIEHYEKNPRKAEDSAESLLEEFLK